MVNCPDGHLFCRSCVTAMARESIGRRDPVRLTFIHVLPCRSCKDYSQIIRCMDGSNCQHTFPPSVLRQCLDTKSYDLWQDILQEDSLDSARIEGLERCPKCSFAIIFEVDFKHNPELRCQRTECGFVSCRRCKEGVQKLPFIAKRNS
jgi:E3 ubiquitin-protein ligase RNF216